MYNPGQAQLQPYKPNYNFLGQIGPHGYIKYDAQGNLIPKGQRISAEEYAKNPWGHYGAGNAINPIVPATPNFLNAYGGVGASPNNPITAILSGGFQPKTSW